MYHPADRTHSHGRRSLAASLAYLELAACAMIALAGAAMAALVG